MNKEKGDREQEQGWLWVSQSEIAEINPPKPDLDDSTAVSFVPMGAVTAETGEAAVSAERKVSEVKKGYTAFQDGDILFAKITPCMENGKVALVDGLRNGTGFGSSEFHVSRLHKELDARFYLYYFLSHIFRKEAQGNMTGSAGQLRVPTVYFRKVEVPLPPVNEQRRIVAKIEELFSELDKGVESLRTARAQLKTYRQSLLKAAFEGRLTEQWRRDNAGKLETADQLLQRIREEREARYQQQLEEWNAAITAWEKSGKCGGKAAIRKPPPPSDVMPVRDTEHVAVPAIGRDWAELGSLADVAGGITKNQKRQSLPIKKPFLRVANVYANELRLGDMHSIGVNPGELPKVTLHLGDLLIVEGNGSVDQLGRVAVWDGSVPECVHQNHLIRARPEESMISEYIMWFLLSTHGRTCIKGVASSTSGLHTLSISKVQKLPIPLCGTREQQEIVAQIEASLTRVQHLEDTIGNSLMRADSLRQSILKQAFEGNLVPQDPDDEPASVLLERIQAEQEEAPKPRGRRRKANA